MPRHKYHRDRVYQIVGEPGPGAIAVGYVRYSSDMQDPASIVTQKRVISEFAEKKGWKIIRWYEEPAHSAKHEEVEKRPVFAELLVDADAKKFQVALCYSNNRWARNVALSSSSIARLRRAKIWWATADGQFDIDRIQEDAGGIMHTIDSQMNEAYVRQLSKRTIDGKEDRAREGYHNGNVPFGYLDPEYPKAPDGAPSTWRPPRMPARSDPETFPALVRIGELVAEGWTDGAIADEMERGGYISRTARFGERLLSKDTIAAIRRSWFPRELIAGTGHGTVETPLGELVEGKHQAAWPHELWKRMDAARNGQYRLPRKESKKQPHEFSKMISCAACKRTLRVGFGSNHITYYRDTSLERKLPCAAGGNLNVRSSLAYTQFGDILKSIVLPDSWREVIAHLCSTAPSEEDQEYERVRKRREELDGEHKRLTSLFRKGYISEQELDEQMGQIQAERFTLPVLEVKDTEKIVRETISAGETLLDMAEYWSEAVPEERRLMVWQLLRGAGLLYDLERQVIVGLLPNPHMLPVLALGLEATSMWEQRADGIWLREDFWPPRPQDQSLRLSPAVQERAIMLIRQGMPLRKVAELLDTSYDSIYRLARSQGLIWQRNGRKLTPAQLEEAYALLRADVPFRQVARQFGINAESLRRAALRDGVPLRPKGEKLTPTQRRLTPEQQQEAHTLIQSGVSLRQTAKRLGLSRSALEGVLRERTDEGIE